MHLRHSGGIRPEKIHRIKCIVFCSVVSFYFDPPPPPNFLSRLEGVENQIVKQPPPPALTPPPSQQDAECRCEL